MDTFTERQLADDLTEAGEELVERALEERPKHEHEPPRSPYFNTCVLAIT